MPAGGSPGHAECVSEDHVVKGTMHDVRRVPFQVNIVFGESPCHVDRICLETPPPSGRVDRDHILIRLCF